MNVIAKRVTIHISEECNPFSFVFYPIICGKKPSFIISVSILSTFYIEKLRLLGFSIGLLEFLADSLVQQASEVAGMLRTNHDASSTRDTFLFIGLVRLIHVDGICRAHLYASMTGCTFLLTSFGMQGNWFSITIRTIAIHHQSTDGKHL